MKPFDSKGYFNEVAKSIGGTGAIVTSAGNGFDLVSFGTGVAFTYRDTANAKSVNDMLVGEWFASKTKECLKNKEYPIEYEAVRNVLDYSVLSLSDDEKKSVKQSLSSAKECFTEKENTMLEEALRF